MSFNFKGTSVIEEAGKRLFVYSIDKDEELIPMNFKGIDEFFKMLDKLDRKGIGHAMILFDGYNETATELHELPEVRNFVKELFKRYPYVLNYINFDLEGHHVLLSSFLDIETIYAGKRMTFAEHIERHGFHTPMPRMNVYMHFPKELMTWVVMSMFAHGNNHKVTKYADRQVQRLMNIFKRA